MATYRKYQWPELFRAFDQSGLTQAQFCAEHNLNPKYFSRKRAESMAVDNSQHSAFQKVTVDLPLTTVEQASFIIESGRCKVHCPASLPTHQLISLIQALS